VAEQNTHTCSHAAVTPVHACWLALVQWQKKQAGVHAQRTHMGSAAILALPMLCCDSSMLPAPVLLGVCMVRRA
jgi:hypothetical protein